MTRAEALDRDRLPADFTCKRALHIDSRYETKTLSVND